MISPNNGNDNNEKYPLNWILFMLLLCSRIGGDGVMACATCIAHIKSH